MKLKLKDVKLKPFEDKLTGESVDYFWYKAIRMSDGVTLSIGSWFGDLPLNVEIDKEVEKTEGRNGGYIYKIPKVDLNDGLDLD